jgi:ATP-dependent Zn protease
MVCHYGMSDRPGQVSISDAQGRKGPLALTILRAKERIVSEQLARARTLLEKHRPLMDTLVEMLMEKNRLTREDLEKILPE